MSDLYLLLHALRDLRRPKRLGTALVLGMLPAVVAGIWRLTARSGTFQGETVYNTLAATLVFGFILVILAVIFGTGVISQEIEQKTITYLLTRPLPRWRILLIRLVAAVVGITLTLWLAALLLALVTLGPRGFDMQRLGRDLLILPLGALAYGSLFLLVGTLLNRPLLWGLAYAFGWESWVGSLPGHFQKLSLMAYLRVLAPHPQPQGESVDIGSLLAAFNPQTISPTFAGRVLVAVIVVALALA
ncbi:MAG TPA: ABC transporter permease, partial [Armatimonadota bacterium]|nr:ABC transporter permease [Armatimonadota bacterium]